MLRNNYFRPPCGLLSLLRAELAECRAQLKEAHATIALQARTIASLHAAASSLKH